MTIQIERPTPKVSTNLDRRDVLQVNRCSRHRLYSDELQIFDTGDEPNSAKDKLRAIFFDHLSADVQVGILHRSHHLHERHLRSAHFRG